MVKKNKTVKELNVEFEILSERVRKLEEKETSENTNKTKSQVEGIEDILKVYDEKIEKLDKMLEVKLKKNKDSETLEKVRCKYCEVQFERRDLLKEHLQKKHPKNYKCDQCGEVFDNSWKLELHLKCHGNVKPFGCDLCGKEFYFKWRLEKHISDHKEKRKCCHYFNNYKPCPYEEVGCRFEHKDAFECRYEGNCRFKLCQFKHSKDKIGVIEHKDRLEDENINKEDENYEGENDLYDNDSESEDEDFLTDEENEDYDAVTLNDLENSDEKDCGACSKILTVKNSFKCKTCGIANHRTKSCNTCFDHVKNHTYCGGCVYNFKVKK